MGDIKDIMKMPRSKTVAVSGHISFELHTLGWKAFQDLCSTILAEELGQTFQIFSPGKDGGRDGAFQGEWKLKNSETLKGTFTAQCKFTSHRGKSINLSIMKDDIEKARKLSQEGLCDNYFLITNYKITGTTEKQLKDAFKNVGIERFIIFGEEKISQFITNSPKLRRLVPRLYGLGDLSQILDERVYAQGEQLLISLQDDLSKFIPTVAYRKSAKALSQYGFVLLLGEPASGKTTIAATLALSSADEWKSPCIKVESAADFKRHWNPHEPRQFFWVDDVFGTTQYEPNHVYEWNRIFPELLAAIKKGAHIVFTSRDYIYRRAIDELKEDAFPLLKESQIIIDIQDLSITEKEQILYNHIKRGNQSKQFRSKIKDYLKYVSLSEYFQPEIARRLGTKAFTKNLVLTENNINLFVEKPEEFLLDIIKRLGSDEKSALALTFMNGGALKSPIIFNGDEIDVIKRMGGTPGGVISAIQAMKDCFVKLEKSDEGPIWVFKHPTIRDAFASFVINDNELLDIYLTGTPTDKMFNEIVCGNVNMEGTKVVIHPLRYRTIINRIENLRNNRKNNFTLYWKNKEMIYTFLSHRCSKDFLQIYLDENRDILEDISRPGPYLYAVPEVALIKRLSDEGLFTNQYRIIFVSTVKDLAVRIPDPGFLTVKNVRSILSAAEIDDILKAVKEKVIPNLDDIINNLHSNYTSDDDPDSYFSELEDALRAYKKEFSNEKSIIFLIEKAQGKINSLINLLLSEYPSSESRTETWEEDVGDIPQIKSVPGERSIFDDIDE